MKKILPLLFFPCLSFGQAFTIIKDTVIQLPKAFKHEANIETLGVVLSNGAIVYKGMSVRLVKGSLPNGDYNYIATPSNSMEAKLKARTPKKELLIEKVLRKGNKQYGYKYIFIAEGNYLIQLEDALSAGEIELH